MNDAERDAADKQWCQSAAALIVNELVNGELFHPDQASWAREIVAHFLHLRLKAGIRPPILN